MPIILNKQELGTNRLRQEALEILEAGLEAIDTEKIIRRKVRVENGILCVEDINKKITCMTPLPFGEGSGVGRVYFVGIGKCALDGAIVLQDIIGDYLTIGAVIGVQDVKAAEALVARGRIRYFKGTHPLPSEQNVEATKEILKMVENLTENDLVITLISGGGSALFELPIPEVDLDTIIQTTKDLTAIGTDIYELNKVRKGFSQVKGGKFAQFCYSAQIVSLIFSDVLKNDIGIIASGPTVLDIPNERVKNILLVSNHDALIAMKYKAENLGFNTTIETEILSGDAVLMGKYITRREPIRKTCILFGGETTVKVHGNGIGGRNQTMALSALSHMKKNSVLICAASDGWDNSDHAGAIADEELLKKAKSLNLSPQEFLDKSNTYNFFKTAGGAIYTEKLGSNVSDLYIMLYK